MPDYFAMVYVIITGAHFFPYAWFYKTNLYAIFAGIISFGALILGLILPVEKTYLVPVFMSASLVVLTILLYVDSKKKQSLNRI
jgi:CHASE2 domain-containing sensor protein